MKKLILLFLALISTSAPAAPGVIVLAGGGPEGDIGVTTDWSYPLYKRLIENGDVNGDGKIKAVVLSLEQPETNFIVDYLKWMGATSSENLVAASRVDANDLKRVSTLQDADVLFIRGGNQAKAYDFWKGTRLHEMINGLTDRGGSIGGTSSGSMILSDYTMTGGQDYDSKEILQDGQSPLLNDLKNRKKSGINNDFFKLMSGVIVDTHCGERARLGRILGVHAKIVDDFKDHNVLSICLEERTGIAISKNIAQIYGTNAVHFIQETPDTKMIRIKGKPLVYTDLRDDMLTHGWEYDLTKKLPILEKMPKGTEAFVSQSEDDMFVSHNAFTEEVFKTGERKRGLVQTLSFIKLSAHPKSSILLMDKGSVLRVTNEGDLFSVKKPNFFLNRKEISTLVLDCKYCTHRSVSPILSNQDWGKNILYTPGLVNLRVSAISGDMSYNLRNHQTKLNGVPLREDFINCKKGEILEGQDIVDHKKARVGKKDCLL